MAFELKPLTLADGPRCVDIYFTAFHNNTHSLACWPRNVPAVREFWEKMMHDELDEPGAHWLKVVAKPTDAQHGEEEIVGFGKWNEPKPGVEPSVDLPEWPAGSDVKLCNETFGDWAMKHRELMGSRGHYYLEILATDPAYQGKGIGSQIISWGLSRADKEGVEAYLESAPDALRFYQKLGFEQVARTDTFIDNERVKGEWYPEVFMIRPSRTMSSN